jgi:hypothetical protein
MLLDFRASCPIPTSAVCLPNNHLTRAYQDHEIFGTRGRIRRSGDGADPQILLQTDDQPGWYPVPSSTPDDDQGGAENYRLFAQMIRDNTDHPLSGRADFRD